MSTTRARSLHLICALLVVFAAAGCRRSSSTGASSGDGGSARVRLALNWVPEPEFGGFYAARQTGRYRAAGLEVDILGGGAGVPVVQMVAGGQADFGIVAADDVVLARARGADVVALFATFQRSPHGLMVHAARGRKTMAEALSGGTLAIEPGIPLAVFLEKKLGFGRMKVVPYDGGIARFLRDPDLVQQCYITAEPLAARKAGSDPQVFLAADEGWNPYQGVIITRRALLRERPALVRAFVAASRQGWRDYLADPAPANAEMARLNPASDPVIFTQTADIQRPLIEHTGLGSMTAARWEALARQMAELKLVDKPPPASDLFAMP